jgi:hypothetical protein
MSKKKRLSHDQRRKAKLAKRPKSPPQSSSLAYSGNRYKTDEFIPAVQRTEVGIYETFVMTDRKLTDGTVKSALETLVRQMRKGPLPPFEYREDVRVVEGQEEDLLIWNIRRNWHDLQQEGPPYARADLIGVLRTLLNSISIWSTPSPQSRGYLNYIEGFLKQTGVSVRRVPADGRPVDEPEEDELLQIGRPWCEDNDQKAAAEFRQRAEELIRQGEGQRVAEVCQRLIGEYGEGPAFKELSLLAIRVHRTT